MSSTTKARPLFDPPIVRRAIVDSFLKLNPQRQLRNPVMFTVFVGSILTTGLGIHALVASGPGIAGIHFRRFGLAVVHGAVRQFRRSDGRRPRQGPGRYAAGNPPRRAGQEARCAALRRRAISSSRRPRLRKDDVVLVEAGDMIPSDGEVIEGVASVDESAITGESAPVIRESGGDRSSVTGGTRVLSDWLVVRVTANPGETFLDRMIGLVEGAKRQKTPNEIALDILLAAMTIIFLFVCATLLPFSKYSVAAAGQGNPITVTVLVALLVCLIPTTIGGLLSAIGIAGMDRMIQANVIAMSGRAVEAAGDVDVLLLDKTGTITMGNRQAVEFIPANGVDLPHLADAAQLASLADETPEGRSIVVLAKEKYGLRGRNVHDLGATFIPFSAQTRLSGVDLDGRQIRKGAAQSIEQFVGRAGRHVSGRSAQIASTTSRARAARRWSLPTAARRSASST